MTFIDFRQVFNSTERNQLFTALEFQGTPGEIIKLIKMILDYTMWTNNMHLC
jgi:hypothetical protein